MPDNVPTEPQGDVASTLASTTTAAVTAATWLPTRVIVQVMVVMLSVAAALWVLYQLEGVLLLVLLAMFFAYLLAPLVEMVHRVLPKRGRGQVMPKALAIGIVYLLLFGVVGVGLSFLMPRVGAQITEFGRLAPTYAADVRDRVERMKPVFNPEPFPPAVRDAIDTGFARTMDTAGKYLTAGVDHPFTRRTNDPMFIDCSTVYGRKR